MDEVVVKDVPDQLALTVKKRVSMATVARRHRRRRSAAIMAHAGASGAQFAGPPFCLYPARWATSSTWWCACRWRRAPPRARA